eukprot:m.44584 g.44584  ORF g.44584 m.44584 type:complete len:168 (+) comp13030_c0_seq1:1830-2333(+)
MAGIVDPFDPNHPEAALVDKFIYDQRRQGFREVARELECARNRRIDVVLRRGDDYLVVEAKYIDLQDEGRTARSRRTNKRTEVKQQAAQSLQDFHEYMAEQPYTSIEGMWITNEGCGSVGQILPRREDRRARPQEPSSEGSGLLAAGALVVGAAALFGMLATGPNHH